MLRKNITPPKKITPEMLEKGRVLLSRDIFNGISSYVDADANNDFNQLNDLCEKFENEHNEALNNLDESIVNLINAIQNKSMSVEQYNTSLQLIHDNFKDYLSTRIISVPNFIDYEQQIQLIINGFDKTTGQNIKKHDSQEIFNTFRQVLISRRELASHNKNLHATASNWLVKNSESAKNIWDNVNEFNELIGKSLAGDNLVIKRRQELHEILINLNPNPNPNPVVPNPNEKDSKEQEPPPYSEQKEPHYPASQFAPIQYGIPGGLNPVMPQQYYEPIDGFPAPSAPIDMSGIKIIQVASKKPLSSELVMRQLQNPQALVRTPVSQPLQGRESPPRISNSSDLGRNQKDSPHSSGNKQPNINAIGQRNDAPPPPSVPLQLSSPKPARSRDVNETFDERRQRLFKAPAKAVLVQRAEEIKQAYIKGCAEEKHFREMEAEFKKKPSTFPPGSYFHNSSQVFVDKFKIVNRNNANSNEYTAIRKQLDDVYKHSIPYLEDIETWPAPQQSTCCTIM